MNPSNRDKLERFAENHYVGFSVFGLAPEALVLAQGEQFVFITGCAGSWLNAGIARRVGDIPAAALVARTAAELDSRGLNGSWRVFSDTNAVPGGEDFWRSNKWESCGTQSALHLALPSTPVQVNSDLAFTEACTRAALTEFYHVFTAAFEGDQRDCEFLINFGERFVLGDRQVEVHNYVGYLGSTPVACGTLFGTAPLLGIYNIGVLPEFRGRGYASAMVSSLLAEASRLGIKEVGLIDSPMSARLYPRFGFEPVGTMHFFCSGVAQS